MQADQITLVRMTTENLTDYSTFPWCSIYQLRQEAVGLGDRGGGGGGGGRGGEGGDNTLITHGGVFGKAWGT